MCASESRDAEPTVETSTAASQVRGPKGVGWQRFLLGAAVLVLLVAASCLVVALVGSYGSSSGSAAHGGLPLTICAGVTTQPRYQVGVVWVSPISSYLPPMAASKYAVCFRVPTNWIPTKPWDEWVFPP
jgi:hypothetical protein